MSTTLPTEGRIAYLYTARPTPAADTALVVTLPAIAGRRNVLRSIDCAYTVANPATASILVEIAGVAVWGLTLPPAIGVYSWPFSWGLYGAENTEMKITLGASGNTSVGTLNVTYET